MYQIMQIKIREFFLSIGIFGTEEYEQNSLLQNTRTSECVQNNKMYT